LYGVLKLWEIEKLEGRKINPKERERERGEDREEPFPLSLTLS